HPARPERQRRQGDAAASAAGSRCPTDAAHRPQGRAVQLPARERRTVNRRRSASIAANPVLIGAATTLVVLVAVFLAYNANNGLPFVPTYQLKAEVPSATNLVKGNDVRIGGARVGVVDAIQAH